MRFLLSTCIGLIVLWSPSHAIFGRPDLEKIPIEKLIKNLSEAAKREPEDANVWHNLARVHGMAYSKKLPDGAEISLRNPSKEIWFGYLPKHVPYAKLKISDDPAVKSRAEGDLKNAIGYYGHALKLKPDDAKIQLGYGWCLQQAGKKAEAIEAYRTAIKQYWKTDQNRKGRFGPVGPTVDSTSQTRNR